MPEQRIQFHVPDNLEPGVYANAANVWHSPFEMTIDFGIAGQPRGNEDGSIDVPVRVTSRIRVPIAVVFPLLQALNENLAKYEAVFGQIQHGQNLQIPPDLLGGDESNG